MNPGQEFGKYGGGFLAVTTRGYARFNGLGLDLNELVLAVLRASNLITLGRVEDIQKVM